MRKIKPKIFFVATVEFAINSFLLNHLRELSKHFNLTVLVNTTDSNFLAKQGINAEVIHINIARNIKFFSDFFCLIHLVRLLIIGKPFIVHSITPKAGLLAMIASFICFVPIRIHTFTGQVWVNKDGLKKIILKFFDRLIATLATMNIVDSPSQRNFLINENVLSQKKSIVFGSGSVSGVDLKKFRPQKKVFNATRNELDIPLDAFLFIFLGRLNLSKGILDLAKAFSEIDNNNAYLIFVGPDEGTFTKNIESLNIKKKLLIRFVNFTSHPEKYLAASNALCLPSYREGFGSVIIEAASMGIPAIASNIYGISDAVVDMKTGMMHDVGDIKAIKKCMHKFLNNPDLVCQLGRAAKERANEEFNSQKISKEWLDFYLHLVKNYT